MPFSTWNWPNHLSTPCSEIITSSEMSRPVRSTAETLAIFKDPLSLVSGMQLPLEADAIARHAEADDEEERAGEDEPLGREAVPIGVAGGDLDNAEQLEQADDDHQRRIHELADEAVDQTGDADLERLRQDDEGGHQPEVEAERHRPFILAFGDRLQPAAHHLGHVGGTEHGEADHGANQLVDTDPLRQEQRQ